MATSTVLLETLYLSKIITETPMVGIHQIQQKSIANNILKTGIPPKKGWARGRRDNEKKKKDSRVTKNCS